MKKVTWNIFLTTVFLIVTVIVLLIGSYYKTLNKKALDEKQYSEVANAITDKFNALVEEKKSSTLTIGLSFLQNPIIYSAIQKRQNIQKTLNRFSVELAQETNFKNVWFKLLDAKGVVLSRSWNNEVGDIEEDFEEIKSLSDAQVMVQVGNNDLIIRGVIPVFSPSGEKIGFFETITHFNSIAMKIQKDGYESVIIVDKRYKERMQNTLSGVFAGDYYIANISVDTAILEYVKAKKVSSMVDNPKNYTLDREADYFIVSHTILGDKEVVASVLMFKKLQDIETNFVKNSNLYIDITMVFLILLLLLSLAFASKQERDRYQSKTRLNDLMLLILVLLVTNSIYYVLLNFYQESENEQYLQEYNANIKKDYQIIQSKFKTISELMFDTTINNKDVTALMKKAYTTQKERARGELLKLLEEKYADIKKYGVRQLHFHLKKSESFLRVHRADKYGDDLTNLRDTVKWVNENYRSTSGFEEGLLNNGFRYVFPLFYESAKGKKEHVGSVEISFDTYTFLYDFSRSHSMQVDFLVSTDILKAKELQKNHLNYIPSAFDGFYYEQDATKVALHKYHAIKGQEISDKKRDLLKRKIFRGDIFTLMCEKGRAFFTFIPIIHPVSNKVVALVLLQRENTVLEKRKDFFNLGFVVGSLLILLVTIFVFRERTHKQKFRELSLKARHIIDSQDAMVIITDGVNIYDENQKFLEFFGYSSLQEFKEDYKCVCERFIKDANYFNLDKLPENTLWVHFLEHKTDKERRVLIADKNGIEHSFSIALTAFENSHFIVTFADISETMQEHFVLANKALHDKLTGIYNREFFDNTVSHIIHQNNLVGRRLGLVMFDIDYFKKINDYYGHNIGDTVLVELATRVRDSIREEDFLIRWGGEEFIVLVSVTSFPEVEAIAEHLRSMIEHHSFEYVKEVTCSFGVTLYREDEAITQTIQRADQAMYLSKKNGRNCVSKL